MAAILPTTFSHAFSSMTTFQFQIQYNRAIFLGQHWLAQVITNCHNERDSVSNNRRLECFFKRFFFIWCLMAPSHYLKQCSLIVKCVQGHSSKSNFARLSTHELGLQQVFGYHGWGTTQRREWILDELRNRFCTIFATNSWHLALAIW